MMGIRGKYFGMLIGLCLLRQAPPHAGVLCFIHILEDQK